MDPAADIIKEMNLHLQERLEEVNEEMNKKLAPTIRKVHQIKYSKFRECILK